MNMCEPERNDCDDDAVCVKKACVSQGDIENGASCSQDRECESGHCEAGVCCSTGDCCRNANDCSNKYRTAATCKTPELCQGTRVEATCDHYQYGSEQVDDDSACSNAIVARRCPDGEVLTCAGAQMQTPPAACPIATPPVAG
jgi:hypothetical protein